MFMSVVVSIRSFKKKDVKNEHMVRIYTDCIYIIEIILIPNIV